MPEATRKLSRKEREHEFRVNIVLDAAEEVFGEASYAKASVEDIAERAEISVGTLYNLFRSKEDIYRSVVSRSQNAFFDSLAARVDEARGPRDKVQASIAFHFEHFSRLESQMRLYVSATNGFQWDIKSKLSADAREAQNRFRVRLTDICQEGVDLGIFKKGVSADLLAQSIIGVPHSFMMVWLDEEGVDLMSLLPAALLVVDRVMGTDV